MKTFYTLLKRTVFHSFFYLAFNQLSVCLGGASKGAADWLAPGQSSWWRRWFGVGRPASVTQEVNRKHNHNLKCWLDLGTSRSMFFSSSWRRLLTELTRSSRVVRMRRRETHRQPMLPPQTTSRISSSIGPNKQSSAAMPRLLAFIFTLPTWLVIGLLCRSLT